MQKLLVLMIIGILFFSMLPLLHFASTTSEAPAVEYIHPLETSGTVYIRADGSIDPPTAPISTADNITYTLTGNITSDTDGIVIETDNIVVDGAGYTVQGTASSRAWGSGNGITLTGRTNVTIQNTTIKAFDAGICLSLSSGNSISGNTFANNGLFVWDSYGNVVKGNIVNGKPLVYVEGMSDYAVDDAGQVILVNCDNIRVENLSLSNASVGVELWSTNNTKIANNTLTANNWDGLDLYFSSNNSISGNNVTANNWLGIELYDSCNNNVVSGNNVANNVEGIELYDSCNNNVVSGNNVANNEWGIWLYESSNNSLSGNNVTTNNGDGVNNGDGIYLCSSSDNNVVSGNNITANNGAGIYLDSCNNNVVSGNNVANNGYGIRLSYSSNNYVFHNSFVNNIIQVVLMDAGVNIWDDGYPSGGNYWSDYNSSDLFSGSHQNETGSDGIGDTPYIIDASNIDNYPLVQPWVPYENGTIYIRADGSVDPSGAPVHRKGDSYVLVDNITSNADGIVIEKDNIVLDGMGHIVQGTGGGMGIYLTERTNTTIQDIQIKAFGDGIHLNASAYCSILESNISANHFGIYLIASSSVCIAANNMTDNSRVIWLDGSSKCSIDFNTITSTYYRSNEFGIILIYGSSCCNVTGNDITCYQDTIVSIHGSSNNTIAKNNVTSIEAVGIGSVHSPNTVIAGNNVTCSYYAYGIFLQGSDNNSISSNNIVDCDVLGGGFGLSMAGCSACHIYHNNFINNTSLVEYCSGCHFYHNNFINNTGHFEVGNSVDLDWDDGHPSGGNYWSDYNGTDLYGGRYQNETGSDGIGDTPYTIDSNNGDNYPLMGPFSSLGGISAVSNSTISSFQFSEATISFSVTGPPGTTGFCTLTVQHSALSAPYIVTVDGNPIPHTTIFEDDTMSIIYFTYQHSTHEVAITRALSSSAGAGGKMPYMD
jgi:parallel beta-helix repeat protein